MNAVRRLNSDEVVRIRFGSSENFECQELVSDAFSYFEPTKRT